jgi:hypothetical protein
MENGFFSTGAQQQCSNFRSRLLDYLLGASKQRDRERDAQRALAALRLITIPLLWRPAALAPLLADNDAIAGRK